MVSRKIIIFSEIILILFAIFPVVSAQCIATEADIANLQEDLRPTIIIADLGETIHINFLFRGPAAETQPKMEAVNRVLQKYFGEPGRGSLLGASSLTYCVDIGSLSAIVGNTDLTKNRAFFNYVENNEIKQINILDIAKELHQTLEAETAGGDYVQGILFLDKFTRDLVIYGNNVRIERPVAFTGMIFSEDLIQRNTNVNLYGSMGLKKQNLVSGVIVYSNTLGFESIRFSDYLATTNFDPSSYEKAVKTESKVVISPNSGETRIHFGGIFTQRPILQIGSFRYGKEMTAISFSNPGNPGKVTIDFPTSKKEFFGVLTMYYNTDHVFLSQLTPGERNGGIRSFPKFDGIQNFITLEFEGGPAENNELTLMVTDENGGTTITSGRTFTYLVSDSIRRVDVGRNNWAYAFIDSYGKVIELGALDELSGKNLAFNIKDDKSQINLISLADFSESNFATDFFKQNQEDIKIQKTGNGLEITSGKFYNLVLPSSNENFLKIIKG